MMPLLAISYFQRRLQYVSLDKLRNVIAGKGLQNLFWKRAQFDLRCRSVFKRRQPLGVVRFVHCLIPTSDRFLSLPSIKVAGSADQIDQVNFDANKLAL